MRHNVQIQLFIAFCGLVAGMATPAFALVPARSGCWAGTECVPGTDALKDAVAMKPEDSVYREYFAPVDGRVQSVYQERWRYQDMEMPYAGPHYTNEHVSIGTRDTFGHGPYEGTVRHQFAEQVLRMRVDGAMKAYFAPTDRAVAVKSAKQAIDQMKSVPLRVSDSKDAGQFFVGYDFLSDSSKIEYQRPGLRAGFYKNRLVAAPAETSQMSLRLTANPGGVLPSANVSYSLGGSLLEGGLSKPLSETVTAELVSSHPLREQTVPHTYEARMIYRF